MKIERACNGFILITTLIILSLAMVLISYLINRSTVFSPLAQTVIEREKAKELAFSGLQLASSQLAYADIPEKDDKPGQQAGATGDAQAKQMIKTLLPVLNKWQTVKLEYARDGVDGEIKICIMSEDGKINLNELYDFEKHTFVGKCNLCGKELEGLKKLLQEIFGKIKKAGDTEGIFESLETFLKERNDKLRDVTELIMIPAFATFKHDIFYNPDKPSSTKEKNPLYLTDIFTIWTSSHHIDPWLFSHSLLTLLDLSEPSKEAIANAVKNFKNSYSWPDDWNKIFSKFYNKDFNTLPKNIANLFGSTFGPETFSVLSYGTVGQITHRLFAIVQRDTTDRDDKEPAKVLIKKLYCI